MYNKKKAVRRFNVFCLLSSVALLACGEDNGGAAQAAGAGSSSVSATTSGASTGGTAGSGGAASSGADTSASGMGGAGAGGAGAGGAGAGGAGAGGAGDGGAGAGGAGGSALPPITDYSVKGPFATTVERNVGPNGAYTVFRPEPLGADGFLHAPIVFGPGIGQQVSVHTNMLTNFASHGFVVVGCPVLSGGPGDAGNLKKMEDGLNWILEQNDAPGKYQGKLYVDHAVSMGFSVGGTSAVQLGGHEAVATVVSIHGHRASADLHGTMLQTTGTRDTVGMPLQQATYDMSEVPTFLATLTGAPHAYIESDGGGEERPAIVAWMRYWIYNDMGARDHFFGDNCVLCKAPWENPQRKNWK
ncbi:alpha/beta hydrolase [Sorangium sp. So ce367]|uniref:alpha/beta hydrolase n=1 Tax=Sorangium sp. So ce367 TaxID=3133305 RepID=UPI003F6078CC